MIRRLIILLLIVGCEKQVSEDNHNGIKWGNNLDSAFAIASKSNKLIMIDFMAEWCPPCKEMDKNTFSNTNIINKSNEYFCFISEVPSNGFSWLSTFSIQGFLYFQVYTNKQNAINISSNIFIGGYTPLQ